MRLGGLSFRACLVLVMSAACSTPDASSPASEPEVVGGREVRDYPEVVHVSLARSADCTGTLIAPKVVLTAGHCVDGQRGWYVSAPLVGPGVGSDVESAAVYDYVEGCGVACQDVGLLFLTRPIELARYPKVSADKLRAGSRVFSVGKRIDGARGPGVYATPKGAVEEAGGLGVPFMVFREPGVLEHGDSGGPTFLADSSEHAIVAVNAAITRAPSRDFLQKLDVVAEWIDSEIRSRGGGSAPSTEPGCETPSGTIAVGASIPDPRSSCNRCTCSADGRLACTERACETPPTVGCMYEGQVVPVGGKVSVGCNTCTCRQLVTGAMTPSGTMMMCTQLACR